MKKPGYPDKQGLYDPAFEHDSCGVGFVVHVKGKKSHDIVVQGLTVLDHLSHRGAQGADPKTGDGAGILIQMPHAFFEAVLGEKKVMLPASGSYAAAMLFIPRREESCLFCVSVFERIARECGLPILAWRDVPVNDAHIGGSAREVEPLVKQVFVGRPEGVSDHFAFERKLYVARRLMEKAVADSDLPDKKSFYFLSFSSRTIVYKGLLMSGQLRDFYSDLNDGRFVSALALVHSRYSTNTFPTWDLSQPFRYLAHNGEINTLRGNINWMTARRTSLASELFGEDMKKIFPVIVPGGSDSAALDNVVEFLLLSGRSLEHVMMMLIPEAWENNKFLEGDRRKFYEYHAALMEPWDGPAAVAFTDGTAIGAILDRNGLRPARYWVTADDLVVMASEVGVLDIPQDEIVSKGRLQPGKMFLVDTAKGRILDDDEIKRKVCSARPYGAWVDENLVHLSDLPEAPEHRAVPVDDLLRQELAFGYTKEDIKVLLVPMAETGQEPTGSMGSDMPLAVLSNRPQPLYTYFKQLFAQVTNPPIDSIREKIVMSLEGFLGRQRNLLTETPEHCSLIKYYQPVLSNGELERLRYIRKEGFRAKTLSLLFEVSSGSLAGALERLCREASACIEEGVNLIILSDKGTNEHMAAIPSLLAVAAVHHHLVRQTTRMQASLIVETADAREIMHFALLLGYGANAVNPYLAYEVLLDCKRQGESALIGLEDGEVLKHYVKAVDKGLLKIFSKMGISTLQSYCGAQIFEALGLSHSVIDKFFTGTVSRIGGVDLEILQKEVLLVHQRAYPKRETQPPLLPAGGWYQYRKDGEYHLWNPDTISALQQAVRNRDYKKFKEFTGMINDQAGHLTTLRSLLKFRKSGTPVPLDEVEPVSAIVKRFATGAMSFGSISKEAHEAMAIAMNRLGAMSNSGEGGEDPERYVPLSNGDSRRSRVKQVASGRFGVTNHYLLNADELQIKMAQGAKPGEGGQLPGHKVDVIVAKIRHSTPGVTLISPPPHHDIYSIEDLAQLIFDLKNANPRARISVKLVSEVGVGTIAAGVAKGHAEMILISGYDGGTGASPLSSIKHAGLPWELGLSETHQVLVMNNLRGRVRLQTDGQMRTGKDVVVAAMLGAEEFGFATCALVVLGCVMLRHCHMNTCSVGVATQDPALRCRFRGTPEHLIAYFTFLAQEVREILAELGFRKMDDLIGRVDLLETNDAIRHWKSRGVDFSNILFKPPVDGGRAVRCVQPQDYGLDKAMDLKLIDLARPALEERKHVRIETEIRNTNRTVGAMLSGEISRRYGEKGLPADTIQVFFKGSAGQSFGAFGAPGVSFHLEGDANDYLGKGLSGARIVVVPPRNATFKPEENIIVGNTLLYGATGGEVFIRGVAGERFGVRNSGAHAVVEGVGDHGCEYMTGGRVVVIGRAGRNFAAGMSGGIAYVYDKDGDFKKHCNLGMVDLEPIVRKEDVATIRGLLEKHVQYTESAAALGILDNWAQELKKFVRVMPLEYKLVMEKVEAERLKAEEAEVSDG
ncbi:glutamate synthase large subunit [Candidatus Velamenicoccus archaeovorus]|uniref:Glutamate synthase [NADPH] large chain n=1 Tax=Velamenicoccus archaeovorus TaxID=1930593 RepID=A0A410P5H3_VELA1|nr:glutamate synthase large subunit [Candidatus Velamenicoccus archaeovorus]QAT17445.1 glutamate synthase large subunit [Candidatus Velamenicoccus archaeovorus]